jgi:hypothetical protein
MVFTENHSLLVKAACLGKFRHRFEAIGMLHLQSKGTFAQVQASPASLFH